MTKRAQPSVSSVTTALIYTRVSSDEQAREGLSLPAQLAACRRYVAEHGETWAIGHEYQDAMSGGRDDRPDYQRLLTEARVMRARGESVVVVVRRLDRIGRRLLERIRCREELKKLGIATHSIAEGGEVSDLMANLLAVLAQEEVERLGARLRETNDHLRSQGWAKIGRCPFGYRHRPAEAEERARGAPKTVLVVDPEAAPIALAAFERAASGESLRSISRWLAGLPSDLRGDRTFPLQCVRTMLRSRTYIGEQPDGSPGAWGPVVPAPLFTQVEHAIERHGRVAHQATGRYLLTGLLRCPRCDARLYGAPGGKDPRRNGHQYPSRYTCPTGKGGGAAVQCSFSVYCHIVDEPVLQQVAELLPLTSLPSSLKRLLRAAWKDRQQPETGTDGPGLKLLQQHATKARDRIKRLALLLADDTIDKEGYQLGREQAVADLQAAERAIAELGPPKQTRRLPSLEAALGVLGDLADVLDHGSIARQRELLVDLIERVNLTEDQRWQRGERRVTLCYTGIGLALLALKDAVAQAAS